MSVVLSPLHAADRDLRRGPTQPVALSKSGVEANARPVKVIYIAGYGRSGTTLLDIALGEHPAIMGGGEISTLARHVWVNDEYCACGAGVRTCPLWRDIVDDWRESEPHTLIADYRQAQERTETIAGIGRLVQRLASGRHATRTAKLFRSIAMHSGCSIVVDSSKLPGRGFALAGMPGIDLHVVHVVRDARGVAWSLKKGFKRQVDKGLQRELRPKPLFYTALRWSIVNLAAEILCRRLGRGRSLRIRYEDFASDPQAILAKIVTLAGERPVASAVGPLAPHHQVAGSRHRMLRSITVDKDERWKVAMPRRQRWFVSALTALLLWRYGYALRTEQGE